MADFDPDAYLAAKSAPAAPAAAFDPDAYLREKGGAQAPGVLATFADNALHGATAGFSDELRGAAAAVGGKLADALGLEKHPESMGDLYRKARDSRRAELKAEHDAHPIAATAGDITGSMLPMLIPGVGAAGEGLAGAMKVGAGMGALRGLGESTADGGMALDTLKGGALGGATGGLGYVGGKLVRALGAKVAPTLEEMAVNQGRKVLYGGAQRLSVKAPVSADAVQEALDIGAIRPLSTSKAATARLGEEADKVGDQYSGIIEALEKKGITGPDARTLAQSIEAEGQSVGQRTLNNAVPKVYADAAEGLTNGTTYPGATAPPSGPLSLTRTESLKRSLQRMAQYDKMAPADVNEARKGVASMLRQSVEDSIAQQAPAAGPEAEAIAAQFVPVKQQYGRLAEALAVAERGQNQAAARSSRSLTSKLAGSSMAAAHGILPGVAMQEGHAIASARLPSTLAWLADRGAKLGAQAPDMSQRLGQLGPLLTDEQLRMKALTDALRRPALPPGAMGDDQ